MRLKISHLTTYRYDAPVEYALLELRLTPKSRAGQKILSWQTHIEGGRQELEFDDQNANHVALVSLERNRQEISITSQGEVETSDHQGIIGKQGGYAPLWYFTRSTALTETGPQVQKLVETLGTGFESEIAQLHALSGLIGETVAYETGRTQSNTSAEGALKSGHGVCQDHAHIFSSAARSMGIPTRYVSGYLMMDDRVEQDASHAWAEAHIDGIGWVGFDVSNGISPDERYVRVATGLDYRDAAPVSGMRFGNSAESMIVTLQVQQ
ncbi:MAG: transglutaminase family protein [Fimbriimonadaceae bacterium]|nr:transglutaminase family protein [Alphaproteobacteria bacterium]